MEDLKECPFCGGSPAVQVLKNGAWVDASVVCQHCRASVGIYVYIDTKENYDEDFIIHCACKRWNKRWKEPEDQ